MDEKIFLRCQSIAPPLLCRPQKPLCYRIKPCTENMTALAVTPDIFNLSERKALMVKLPFSDYVASYYKEQGIRFTFREQAALCWQYNDSMEDRLAALREILFCSDDEKLNAEIRKRIALEELAGSGTKGTKAENDYAPQCFENMFLNIKSPFGLGDIVMGPDFDCPRIVSTSHECFEELNAKFQSGRLFSLDCVDNCIRTDFIDHEGHFCYDHTKPFALWKIDFWPDKTYWRLLKIMQKIAQTDTDIFNLPYYIEEYMEHHAQNDELKTNP